MSISNQIHHALMQHPLWALIGTVIAGYGVLHILRKHRMRRHKSEFDIPNFLSGRSDGSNDGNGSFKGAWTEVRLGRRPPKD